MEERTDIQEYFSFILWAEIGTNIEPPIHIQETLVKVEEPLGWSEWWQWYKRTEAWLLIAFEGLWM